MQVGVDPGAVRILDVLCRLVGSFPITASVMPERQERGRESGWRLRFFEAFCKFSECHAVILHI